MIGGRCVAGILILLLLSGCLGAIEGEPEANGTEPGASTANGTEQPSSGDAENATTEEMNRAASEQNGSGNDTDTTPDGPTGARSRVEGGSMRGRARPLALGTITPDMNQSRYLPANDTIRYVEFWFGSPDALDESGWSELEPHYGYVRFDEWAEQTCAETAARRAAAFARNRTDATDVAWGVGRANGALRPLVEVTTLVDRSGQVTETPGVTLEELAVTTPRSVAMTLRLGERTERCERTITVRHSIQRLL